MDSDDLYAMLLDEKDKAITSLRAELATSKKMERKLWVAVARLQQAVGEAHGWGVAGSLPTEGDDGYGNFDANRDAAAEILDGIVALTPAE